MNTNTKALRKLKSALEAKIEARTHINMTREDKQKVSELYKEVVKLTLEISRREKVKAIINFKKGV